MQSFYSQTETKENPKKIKIVFFLKKPHVLSRLKVCGIKSTQKGISTASQWGRKGFMQNLSILTKKIREIENCVI